MNKFTKVCLIAGGVCVLIGGGITTVAAAMGGSLSEVVRYRYNYNWPGRAITDRIRQEINEEISSEMEDFHYQMDEELKDEFDELDDYAFGREGITGPVDLNAYDRDQARKLELEVRRGRVVILPDSSTDQISVECETGMKGLSTYYEEDELKVTVGSRTWNSDEDGEMLVYIHVPEDHRFDEVELKVKAQKNYGWNHRDNDGPSIAAEDLKAGKLEIDADVGAVIVTGGDTGSLEADADVGAVEYEGMVSGDVEADCSVGAMKLDLAGEKADYNYEIKSRIGSVNVDGEAFAGLSSEKRIDNGAVKKMELECKTGAIDVKFH